MEHPVGMLLKSLSVLDDWLDDNAGKVMDEVLEQLDSTGLQLEAVRQELE